MQQAAIYVMDLVATDGSVIFEEDLKTGCRHYCGMA